MSFRKRNVLVSRNPVDAQTRPAASVARTTPEPIPGVKPSPIDGRPVTSTGTPSLDSLLAGHGGLALGNALLIEENGTTDYAGALLKYYAAEGVVQGHVVHVFGMPPEWGRELPGMVAQEDSTKTSAAMEKMKIAWRYEGMGEFGVADSSARRAAPTIDRNPSQSTASHAAASTPFCHTYDLTKRLDHPKLQKICYTTVSTRPTTSPLEALLQHLEGELASSSPNTMHRVVIPNLLSPAVYPPHASHPSHLLSSFHILRALLRQHSTRLTVMLTLPLPLFPRSTGLIRMLEHLVNGVMEVTPFPHLTGSDAVSSGAASKSQEEKPQGMIAIHKLPVLHDGGGVGDGMKGLGEDLVFTVSRKKFEIRPFNLPPADGDNEAQDAGTTDKPSAKAMEF